MFSEDTVPLRPGMTHAIRNRCGTLDPSIQWHFLQMRQSIPKGKMKDHWGGVSVDCIRFENSFSGKGTIPPG